MTNLEKKESVIVGMTRPRLGDETEYEGFGWNGKNMHAYNGHHLGIFNREWGNTPQGTVPLLVQAPSCRGWGFGHRGQIDDRQGYSWAGDPIDKTVFEIAVKTSALTPGEAKFLLAKK